MTQHSVTISTCFIDDTTRDDLLKKGFTDTASFTFESDKTGLDLLDEVFSLQNDRGPGLDKKIHNLPSMTAGDLLVIDGKTYLCASFGWASITDEQVKTWNRMGTRERMDWARRVSRTVTRVKE